MFRSVSLVIELNKISLYSQSYPQRIVFGLENDSGFHVNIYSPAQTLCQWDMLFFGQS